MEDLKQKLIALVNSLYADESLKSDLVNKIHVEGLNSQVMQEAEDILNVSVVEYQQVTDKQIRELEIKMNSLEKDLNEEFRLLKAEAKIAGIEDRKAHDLDTIAKIKQQLQNN